MGRPKNPKALTPAQRKAESRERKKATGIVRLQTEVEVYTAVVLERVATFLKTTASKVVVDLVADCRNHASNEVDAGEPRIKHVTRELNAKQVDLDLPADVHAWLTTREGASASSVIEMIVNMRCAVLPEELVHTPDCEGTVLTASDFDNLRLVYTHPGDPAVIRTDMYALTPADTKWRICADKYDRRRNAVLDRAHTRQPNVDPYGDVNISRFVEAANHRAMSAHIDTTWERYYDAAPQKGHRAPVGAFDE
jgi:hypothetical protein